MTRSQEPSSAERKIDAVLFDLDGTLLDRDSTLQLFLSEQYDRFEAELSHVGKPAYLETLVELDDHGYIPKTEAYPRRKINFVWMAPSETNSCRISRRTSTTWRSRSRGCTRL